MSFIHRSQCPTEQLPNAIAWEQLRHAYWSRPGWEDTAADCAARINFYQDRLAELLPEHLSNV